MTTNRCGHCTACCVILPIPSIGKSAGRPCRKLHDGSNGIGCAVYADRPGPCRSFRCGWLAEGWEPDLRPDICGVMLTHARSRAGATLVAWELRPGTIRAAWDLWVERAKDAPIAIHFIAAPSVLLCRDGHTVPIPGPSHGKENDR